MDKDVSRQIKLGAVISYLSLGISIIATLLYTPWMVSVIGKSNYALYTLSISCISIFMNDLGLSSAASRFVAKYKAEGNEQKINEFVCTIEKFYLVIDVVIFIILAILYLFLDRIYIGLTSEEITIFRELYLIVAIYNIVTFPCLPFSGILNAYEKFIQIKLCDLFHKLFTVILVIVCLLNDGNVVSVVFSNVISGFTITVIKFVIIKRTTNISLKTAQTDKIFVKEIAQFSIWVTITGLAQRCIFNLAPTILGIVSTSDDIAIFSPANALESYFYLISAAVNGLFLSTISRYIVNKEENKIYDLMVKIGRYQFSLMGFIFVVFLCAGKDFMIAWMGKDYILSWPCALLMFIPDILIFSQQIANTTIIAKNKVKQQALGYIGMACICLGMSFTLCGQFGALGSAISIAVSYFFLFIYMNILYYRVLRINIFGFFRECFFELGFSILISAVLGYSITQYVIPFSGWLGVVTKGVTALVLYFVLLVPVLKKEERRIILRLIKR